MSSSLLARAGQFVGGRVLRAGDILVVVVEEEEERATRAAEDVPTKAVVAVGRTNKNAETVWRLLVDNMQQ